MCHKWEYNSSLTWFHVATKDDDKVEKSSPQRMLYKESRRRRCSTITPHGCGNRREVCGGGNIKW